MNKLQLNAAIENVAKATGQTKQQVADKLESQDHWTWFLVRQS